MNISISGLETGFGTNAASTYRMAGSVNKVRSHAEDNEKNDKNDKQNSTAAVLSISSSKDRSKAIAERYQSMKDSIQKQIEALNDRLKTASTHGNTALEEQLTENIKSLRDDYSALDEQLSKALFEEQQRKAAEAKQKEEEAAKEREKEQEKYKTDEEKVKNTERKKFEFLANSDITKESIQNNKIQKAKMERTKGRLEGEMAIDASKDADKEQRQRARMSALRNGFSFVPYVSDKSILTEKRRIASGLFTPDESAGADELSKLNNGINNLQNSIGGKLAELNEAVKELTETSIDGKDNALAEAKDASASQQDGEPLAEKKDASASQQGGEPLAEKKDASASKPDNEPDFSQRDEAQKPDNQNA